MMYNEIVITASIMDATVIPIKSNTS